ncbi:MAG: hypothetical protein GVY08_00605 [Bacteroidetes bacterium]|nr:hypothetical protein [Bacteroidota bacterium]
MAGLTVYADTSGAITVKWGKLDETVAKNVLEKSLGDSLNFEKIAELEPDVRQYIDTTRDVRKDTYYRISSYLEMDEGVHKLYGSSQAKLEFGEISDTNYRFLDQDNRLELSWKTDVPLFTHFVISSENVITEEQEKSVKIQADGIDNRYVDPLLDIDFETRKYIITGIIEHSGTPQEEVADASISFSAVSNFQPENLEIEILNEQDWQISWENNAFFATEVEVTRTNTEGDIIFNLPPGTTSFVDSLIVDDSRDSYANRFRRYGIRFLTDTGSSLQVDDSDQVEIDQPVIAISNIKQNDPNSLTIYWAPFGNDKELIKEYIIEKSHVYNPDRFVEIARVKTDAPRQYTVTNVNEEEDPIYRVRTVTSYPSEPASFTYSHDYEMDYSFTTGMNYVTSMEVSSDKRYLAAVSFREELGNSILVTDIESEQPVSEITIPSQQISDIKISPDDSSIYFAVPTDEAIYKADFPSGNNIEKIIDNARVNLANVFHIDISPDELFLIGTGGQGFVKRWDLNSYDIDFIFADYNTPTFYLYKNIAISPDGSLIGGNNGSNYMMDSQNGTILEYVPSGSANTTDLQFSGGGNYFTFTSGFQSTSILSTESWEVTDWVEGGRRADFHPEDPVMVLAGRNSVFTYDLDTSAIGDIISDDNGSRAFARFENSIIHIDDDRIGTVGGGNSIQIWKKKGTQRRWKNVLR